MSRGAAVHRVLLVDDQAFIGEAVRRILAPAADIAYAFAADTTRGLEAARSFRPTVILQDLVMPDCDGFDMVRRFRDLAETAEVPVIMLSAREEPAVKARLLEAGANDYLVKLPDAVELIARIRVHSDAHLRLLERNDAYARLEESLAELEREREKSERLLRTILPESIAARLKESSSTIAEHHPAVTVLFADLTGFTGFSTQVDAAGLVGVLDEIFSDFDRLALAAGVEKIKTIGDAYMAVAGLPAARADHADAVAGLAIDMQAAFADIVAARGLPLALRIGIHSGAVVAGVIGRHKFAYDLWGDTVNVASRMESHGEPGLIHVSPATRGLLGDRYRFTDRGAVAVKGRGEMRTFFLLGRS